MTDLHASSLVGGSALQCLVGDWGVGPDAGGARIELTFPFRSSPRVNIWCQ